MKIFLTVWFITFMGESVFVEGWLPREQPTMAVCLERKEVLEANIEKFYVPRGLGKTIHHEVEDYEVKCEEHDA